METVELDGGNLRAAHHEAERRVRGLNWSATIRRPWLGIQRGLAAALLAAGGCRAVCAYLSLIAACTFLATSGGIVLIPWAVLACSAPFFMTSATSCPSMTALQPGIKSPQFSTFAMLTSLTSCPRTADGDRAASVRRLSRAPVSRPRLIRR